MKRVVLVLALIFSLSAQRAYGDEIPKFPWEDILNVEKVQPHYQQRLRRLAGEANDFDLRMNLAKLGYVLWRLEEKDNERRIQLSKTVIRASQEAIQLRPDDPAGYYYLAAGIGMMGNSRGVLNSLQLLPQLKSNFEKSIQLNPDFIHANALAHLGHLYNVVPGFPVSVGDRTKGAKLLLEARKRDPGDSLSYLYMADLLWRQGKPDLALSELEKVGGSKPDSLEQFFTYTMAKRKAAEMTALIKKGELRDPFFDVTSELQPKLFR